MNRKYAINRLRKCRSYDREHAFNAGVCAGEENGEDAVCSHLGMNDIKRVIEACKGYCMAGDDSPCPVQVKVELSNVGETSGYVRDAFVSAEASAVEWPDSEAYREGYYLGFCRGVENGWFSIAEEVSA